MKNYIYITVIALVLSTIAFFHLWQLSEIPKGLYYDETSIGYNALKISESGHDQHGEFLPVFFKAFGEYKNPLYIYTTAIIFKIAGVREFTLRFTSFFYFAILLIAIYFLVDLAFKNKVVNIFCLLFTGFISWFFVTSRETFEVISQPAIFALAILFIYRTYHHANQKNWFIDPILAGFFTGLTLYTYSTSRLLTLIFVALILIIYSYKNLKKTLLLAGIIILISIPYLNYYFKNPDNLTRRFEQLTYIHDANLTKQQIAEKFFKNYFTYLSPDFLIISGDHYVKKSFKHSGFGGQISKSLFVTAIIGLIGLIVTRKIFKDRFVAFIALNFLASPIAAALTHDIHGLRSILMPLYIIILSAYGINYLSLAKNKFKIISYSIIAMLFISLIIESTLYLNHYFTRYSEESISDFETFDYRSVILKAITLSPKKIIFSNKGGADLYIEPEFFKKIIDIPSNINFVYDYPIPEDDSCIIFTIFDNSTISQKNLHEYEFAPPNSYMKLKCYSSNNY